MMKRRISILITLLLGIVLLFGSFGCNGSAQDDLQGKLDDLQSQLKEMENKLAEMDEQLRDRNATIEDLNDSLADLDEQLRERDAVIEDLNGSLADLDERLRQRDAAIEDLNDQIKNQDERIEDLEKKLEGMQDYTLKISAEKTVYSFNETIRIDITLKNQTGADVEFAYWELFFPESSTGQFHLHDPLPATQRIKKNESIHMKYDFNGEFPVGQHELRFRAVFYLAWETDESGWIWLKSDSEIEVWSNTIEFSVSEEKTPAGTFYSLQEAYDNGYLTKGDLEQIAYYNNRGIECSETLSPQIATAIRETEAANWRNRKPEATADDFTIVKYLGTYSGCYVIAMDNIYVGYPQDIRSFWVDDVEFYDGNFYIQVWKINL